MYAIVNIAGQQLKVAKDQKVVVNRMEGEEGKKLEFSDVLLVDDNGKVKVGAPVLKGASVSAKIVTHKRGDKVIIFKRSAGRLPEAEWSPSGPDRPANRRHQSLIQS